MSYLDGGVSHAENINALHLEKSRHILGWRLEVRFYEYQTEYKRGF